MKTKGCCKCESVKPVSEFYKDSHHPSGLSTYCKPCKNKIVARRYDKFWKSRDKRKISEEERRERKLAAQKRWNDANRDKLSAWGRARYEKDKDKIKERAMLWKKNNPERAREINLKYKAKIKKMSHTLKHISTFFTTKLWPYTTDGKNEISRCMKEIMGDVNPTQKNSFLSMPNLGRELNLLQDVIRFEDSVGIERDAKLFRSIQRAFAKFFPTMKVEKDCINNYAINTDKVFDVAHLDYNGFLIEPHLKATEKLINDGTMTFVTLNMHKRFEKMENYRPLEELLGLGNVVFQKEYYGKKKCPMITVGLTA